MVKIYKLVDPRNNQVMYIGKTIGRLCNRMSVHIHCAKHDNTPRDIWIKELIDQGLKPEIKLIEKVNPEIWEDSEKYWINFYKKINSKLCNKAHGGGGPLGKYYSEDVILTRSEKQSKPVYQIDFNFNIVELHDSCKKAAKKIEITDVCISTSARSLGKKSAKGYIWIYLKDYPGWKKSEKRNSFFIDYSSYCKPICQYTKNDELVACWSSMKKAGEVLKYRWQGISRCVIGDRKTYKKFIWKRKEV